MTEPLLCPNCGKSVSAGMQTCPHCQQPLRGTAPLAPEQLVQRLGEVLLESGVIQPQDLQKALDYQKSMAAERRITIGRALVDLGMIDQPTLDQAITRQLIGYQAALENSNRQLEERVQARTKDLEKSLLQIRTAAEITQSAVAASNMTELLRRTTELIIARFKYYHAAIFLVDDAQRVATLNEATGKAGKEWVAKGFKIESGSNSVVGWVLANRKFRVVQNVTQETFYQADERLPQTRSEVSIPFTIGDKVLGILDIQHTAVDAFDADVVAVLQTIANHVGSVIQNFRLLEAMQASLNELSGLYQASYQMARANSVDDVIRVTNSALKQSAYFSVLLLPERGQMRVVSINEPTVSGWGKSGKIDQYPEVLKLSPSEAEKAFSPGIPYLVVSSVDDIDPNTNVPGSLLTIPRQAGYPSVALIPCRRSGKLDLLILLASRQGVYFSPSLLQTHASLAELTATALEKVYGTLLVEKRMLALQTLNTISQAVSVETDLKDLYKVIHREVVSLVGNVNFAIASYDAFSDMISVPYMFDGTEVRQVPAFPLGEGLTSIIIRSRQPLLLSEDTERKIRDMGAKMVGRPAKSWLGVPLLVSGDAIGAIILQDLDRENRFDEDDQRLLVTLASQVAVGIRNARLLDGTFRQASRERRLYDITTKIRLAQDIQSILQITAGELGQALGARRTRIELGVGLDSKSPAQGVPAEAEQGSNETIPLPDPPDQPHEIAHGEG